MHAGGEVDARSAYLVVAAATLAGLDAQRLAERAHLVSFLCRCQTPEVRQVTGIAAVENVKTVCESIALLPLSVCG